METAINVLFDLLGIAETAAQLYKAMSKKETKENDPQN